MLTFEQYTYEVYPNSGAASSYIRAISIMDELFAHNDIFDLKGKSLSIVDDLEILLEIERFVIEQESKYCKGLPSFFDNVGPRQTSYPSNGFCKAAMAHLIRYREYIDHKKADEVLTQFVSKGKSGEAISKRMIATFNLDKEGGERVVQTRTRIGQDYFRKMLLSIYNGSCCVTGLNVPELLRASHINAWKDDKKNRLNPENGLCLSATYDAAFDKHLISFDDDYKMIVSKHIKDYYTSAVTQDYFMKYEGKQISLPTSFYPDKKLLSKHRDQLVG